MIVGIIIIIIYKMHKNCHTYDPNYQQQQKWYKNSNLLSNSLLVMNIDKMFVKQALESWNRKVG